MALQLSGTESSGVTEILLKVRCHGNYSSLKYVAPLQSIISLKEQSKGSKVLSVGKCGGGGRIGIHSTFLALWMFSKIESGMKY